MKFTRSLVWGIRPFRRLYRQVEDPSFFPQGVAISRGHRRATLHPNHIPSCAGPGRGRHRGRLFQWGMEITDGNGAPSARDTKYDRQLRLWGPRGQRALMEARILLVNAGPTGTEILKNLVLPGVGKFVVVDGRRITERDLANNFFVHRKNLGQLRAQVVTDLLSELNPDVTGEVKAMAPDVLLRSEPDFFSGFDLIIATQLEPGTLRELASLAWGKGVPLLVARSYGLLGYVRLCLPQHLILDSRAQVDNKANYNLSLARTLPALQALADGQDLSSMEHAALCRVPFVVVLLKARALWLERHEGKPPTSRTKAQFVELIKELAMDPDDDNFKEAAKFAHLAYTDYELPPHTQELFEHEAVAALTKDSKDFWVLVRALKDFVEAEGGGRLPLSGAVPDMAASTAAYTQLQQLYRDKALEDRAAVRKRVEELLESVGRPKDSIPVADVAEFCRNAYSLQAVRTRSLEEELTSPSSEAVMEALMDADSYEAGPDMNPFLWYIGLRAVDSFFLEKQRYPGTVDAELKADEDALWDHMQRVASTVTSPAANGDDGMMQVEGEEPQQRAGVKREHAVEMTRYGAAEIHNIAAILGGIGAQEAVKVLTQQYVPLNHTLVYNGIASIGAVYQL